jgi:hypothetical protein
MRAFEQQRRIFRGTIAHRALIIAACVVGLWGCYISIVVAASALGLFAATISAVVIFPLSYWPFYAASAGDWAPLLLFYGGWTAAMLLCALYEAVLCISPVERPAKPR